MTALAALPAAGTALDVKATGTRTFYIHSRAGSNQITVLSESTLEDFTSVVNKVGGQCKLDPKNLESFTDHFFFKMADLDTGIQLRNEQMLGGEWFDAERYPLVEVNITRVENVKKTGENTAEMILVGTCKLHGVSREVRIPATLAYLDESPETMRRVKGDLIRLRGVFDIKLSDYKVTGPKGGVNMIGLKVADVQKIRFSVFGTTQPPPPS